MRKTSLKMSSHPDADQSPHIETSEQPFSHIPWLEMRRRITHNILPDIVCRVPTLDKQDLHLALSNSVPIYLPAKFHQMRCEVPKFANLAEAVKEQWDAAFEFVHTCSTFDHEYISYSFLGAIHSNKIWNYPTPIKIRAGSEVQQCQSAAEFLLEPWVLIQMPFQPSLLHQWAVALLAEALTFQKKISAIFSYGCPNKKFLKIFKTLRSLLKKMLKCAHGTLYLFSKMCEGSSEKNCHATLNSNRAEFIKRIQYLPAIEFVTSKGADILIWAIETHLLMELNRNDGQVHPPRVVFRDSDDEWAMPPLYNFWYWTKNCDPEEALDDVENYYGRCNDQLLMDFPSSAHECTSECACPRHRQILRYICEGLLRTKRLAGVDIDTIMAAIEKHIATDFYHHVLNIEQFTKTTPDEEKGFGALNNILCLYTEAKVHEAFNLLTRRIFDIVKKLHPEVTIGSSVESRLDVKHDMVEIKRNFIYILSKEWTWETTLADAKSTCGWLEEISTADIDKHPEKVVEHYQTRVRTLVFNIAKKHFTSWKAGHFEFFPEQQFVQYLLPCFVNCILSVLLDASKSRNVKQKCCRFVEKLIFSYEQNEHSQVLSTEKKIEIKNRDTDAYCDGILKYQKFVHKFAIFLNDDGLIPTFKYFLSNYVRVSENKKSDLERGSWVEYSKWFIQFDMFMHRVINILYCFDNFEDGSRREPVILSECISRAFSVEDKSSICNFPIYLLYIELLPKINPSTIIASTAKPIKRAEHSKVIASMPKKLIKSTQELSCQQLAALFVFLHFGNLDLHLNSQWRESELQGPGFPFDMTSVFTWCIATKDTWKIKQLVAPMLMTKSRRGEQLKDNSFVSLEVAKSNQCYTKVLRKISSDGTKVLMKEKGEITFVPVKHCRWCGLIRVEKFRLCCLCEEYSEYCDVNYFCSEKCEMEALESKHREEHARYYVVKLGLEKRY